MYKNPNPNFITFFIKLSFLVIAYILCVIFLSGCMTTQKATNFLEKKNAIAGICAQKFPIQIDTLIKRDTTIQFATDTSIVISAPEPDKQYSHDSITVNRTIVRTVTITNTVEKENTAKIQASHDTIVVRDLRIANLQGQITVKDASIKKLHKIEFWLIVSIVVLLTIIFRKPIWAAIAKLVNPLAGAIPFLKK